MIKFNKKVRKNKNKIAIRSYKEAGRMKHKMAIIGFGGMGNWHKRKVGGGIPEIDVWGVYDLREEANEKAREDNLKVYSSFEAILEDVEVDIVLVSTPNNFHKDYVIRSLEAGKHVICEKPVAMNAEELEAMMAAAKKANRLFSVHQNRRWDKDYQTVKSILAEESIGTPYFIESRVLGSRGAMHGWRSYQVNGGGMVLDWGVHLIDQALELIDSPVVSVTGHLQSVFSDEVDDNIKILLGFENGVSYLLEMSTNCFINLPRWHVSCTKGTAIVKDWECHGEIVTLQEDGPLQWEDDIVYTAAGPTRTMAPRPEHTVHRYPLPEVETDSIRYYQNIVAVLDRGEELIVKPEQCLRVMKVIDMIFESHQEKHGKACYI